MVGSLWSSMLNAEMRMLYGNLEIIIKSVKIINSQWNM